MKNLQVFSHKCLSLMLVTAALLMGAANKQDEISLILDLSYSIAPNAVRLTEVWDTPEGRMILLSENYCPGHPNFGQFRIRLLRPQGEGWEDPMELPSKPGTYSDMRDAGCELLEEGKFDLVSANDYIDLAYRLRDDNRLEEAAEVFTRGIEVYPQEAVLYHGLGNVLAAQERYDDAIGAYHQAIARTTDPTLLSISYTSLGNALDTSGNFEEALSAYRQAISLAPERANPHYELAIALYGQGRLEEAIQECQLSIQLEPNDPGSQEFLRHLQNEARQLKSRDSF